MAAVAPFERIAQNLLDPCIRCGACLKTCATHILAMEDNPFDREGTLQPRPSPRGRMSLTQMLIDGRVELDDESVALVDTCLGCMACLSSCVQFVEHDALLEVTRAHIEESYRRPLGERLLRSMIFFVFPHPRRMQVALALAPLGHALPVPKRLRRLVELAPSSRSSAKVAETTPAVGIRQARVGLLTGCVQSVVFGNVNQATARVLAVEGCEVAAPKQSCCGALALHIGRMDDARASARRTIDTFEDAGVDYVITNAAGCGSALKEYDRLLADDPAYAERAANFSACVRDVSEVLVEVGGRAARYPLELRVAWQDPCHLRHVQHVKSQPRALLTSIPGLELVEPAEQDVCCGSAGIYNLVQPETARRLGDRKAAHVLATEPDVYVGANPGCLIQVSTALRRAGSTLPAAHLVELVDASIRGVSTGGFLSERRAR